MGSPQESTGVESGVFTADENLFSTAETQRHRERQEE
jgi:hypothetical protein